MIWMGYGLALGSLQADEIPSSVKHPNIIVLLADDAGWGDYPSSGNQDLQLPHIASLARDGVSLDRFYVCPVCSPTRAEFLTGRYHPRSGVHGTSIGEERMDLDEKTIAEAFQRAGYATGAFGKWHNGTQWPYHPRARGFDEYFGHTSGHWGEYFDAPLENSIGEFVQTKGYIADVCTDQALNFITRNKSQPFFCYVPFTTPHSPWAAPADDWEAFRNLPITQRATLPDKENIDETRCVFAMLANQDRNVGRILSLVDKLQLAERTVIVYFSDNGPNGWRWNGGMKGRKGSTDEGGVRSVCYWRWPGQFPAGQTVSSICGAIDLLPTLTALAGIPRVGDKPLDGIDLSSQLRNPSQEAAERMLFSTWNGQVSVRTSTHRLDQNGKLYDMTRDPGQTMPVNQQHPELAARLLTAVQHWSRDVGVVKVSAAPRGRRQIVPDFRPIPVGYPEFPVTILPARDGEPRGSVQRSSNAPNCSYFVNWKTLDDRMVWIIDVTTPGTYAASIDYTCPQTDIGSSIELSFGEQRLAGLVQPAWDPPLNANQDTVARPLGESQMKEFHTLVLGDMRLSTGTGPLVLRALKIPGKTVMDVRRVTLTLKQAAGG